MKIVVLDANTLGDDLDLSMFEKLGETAVNMTTSAEQVPERVHDAEVVIVNKVKLNESNLCGASNLKLICITATGFDNVDLDYCKANNIAVCNVVGYSTHSVAQVTLAMALSLYTHVGEYKRYVDSGEYTKSKVQNHLNPVFRELYGKTWGIIGYGNIGRQVAAAAKAMGCNIMPYSRSLGTDLDEVLRKSDIVSVHLPLNDGTRGLISREKIALMKNDAIFINVARGAVTDEEALAEAVENNKLGGLGIDVYAAEPFDENHAYNRILGRDNVCFTPHMAWGAYEARIRCMESIYENITAFYSGEKKNRLV